MNANELMLGNYLQNKNIESAVQVGTINSDGTIKLDYGICKNVFNNTMTLFSFEGVPLTEKWLLDFGFEKIYDDCYIYNMIILNNKFELMDIDINVKCKHVHQLQNLYFSLTGNPLKLVKPK